MAIRSLTFGWHTARCLQIQRFDLAAGERAMLYGASGSGKSSLLGLLGGVLVPQSGSVEVLGSDLASMTSRERDRFRVDHIGFIFQQFNLVPYLTAVQNVLLPCRFSARRAERALQGDGEGDGKGDGEGEGASMAAHAEGLLESIGIDRSLSQRPVTGLSVGQQQRVAAARALIGRPELILADEPTSALDADAQQVFLDLLLGQCEDSGAALLFVSHDQRLADRFDRKISLAAINDPAS